MRPYQNITDAELSALGSRREWDPLALSSLPLPASVLWVHSTRTKFTSLDPHDPRLIRRITIVSIKGDVIKTDFGSYSLQTGKNRYSACGCKKFCDCYGQLYLLDAEAIS